MQSRYAAIEDRSYLTTQDVAEALGIKPRTAQLIIRRVRMEAVKNQKLPDDYPRGRIPKILMKQYYI